MLPPASRLAGASPGFLRQAQDMLSLCPPPSPLFRPSLSPAFEGDAFARRRSGTFVTFARIARLQEPMASANIGNIRPRRLSAMFAIIRADPALAPRPRPPVSAHR